MPTRSPSDPFHWLTWAANLVAIRMMQGRLTDQQGADALEEIMRLIEVRRLSYV